MPQRHEYVLQLGGWKSPRFDRLQPGMRMRPVEPADLHALAELMLEAYRGTIDYEGETDVESIQEVERFLSPEARDRPLLSQSTLLFSGTTAVSACLVKHWQHRQCPLIGYVISLPSWKRRGLAARVLAESLSRLAEADHREVRAVITEGNVASERLASRMGFKARPSRPSPAPAEGK